MLEAVVTYTTDLGMQQAQAADELLAKGTYLGPLHGIPFGLKDIIAVNGYRTTWGAPEFKNQMINEDANVYQRSADPCYLPVTQQMQTRLECQASQIQALLIVLPICVSEG